MPDRSFIDQLDEVWSSISSLCRPLAPTDWARPTDCPGWSVKDQVSHIIGTESVLLGRKAPPDAPAATAHVRNPIGQFNEAWVDARRPFPGTEILAEFEEVTAARLEALREMSDAQLEELSPSPIGQVPYATFMDVRVMDSWVHEQDIRRALGRPGHLSGGAADTAMRRFTSSLGFVVGKRAAAPDGTTVVFEVSGRDIAIEVANGRAAVVTPAPADPTVHLAMDAETFCCLVAGRWAADDARVAVKMSGDEDLGRRVIANMATIP